MGFLDSLKAWFRTESNEARDLLDTTKSRMEADLDRREAEAAATPAERMEQLQEQIADGGDAFDAIRDKIEGRGLRAQAVEEVADVDGAADHDIEDAELVDEPEGDGGTDGRTDGGAADEPTA
ncbi:MAG: hypothetical protein AAGA93_25135 [Actinomycetota bacterium]